jgi:hypothetical protein
MIRVHSARAEKAAKGKPPKPLILDGDHEDQTSLIADRGDTEDVS